MIRFISAETESKHKHRTFANKAQQPFCLETATLATREKCCTKTKWIWSITVTAPQQINAVNFSAFYQCGCRTMGTGERASVLPKLNRYSLMPLINCAPDKTINAKCKRQKCCKSRFTNLIWTHSVQRTISAKIGHQKRRMKKSARMQRAAAASFDLSIYQFFENEKKAATKMLLNE